jgi:uncharacterized protein (TIGR02246 family)
LEGNKKMSEQSARTLSFEETQQAVLDKWAAAVTERRLDDVASMFTRQALFQGFDPMPGFGRAYVHSYYDKQPIGLTPTYRMLSAREIAPDVALVYARVLFARPDGDADTYLTAVIEKHEDQWLISHYHASKILKEH